ncbi:hypothetical protein QBC44DRAFT_378613 [Cladorrhinum sp. PSN332]|nr:hypothetical protein QBC44DRAFT_378613 [Cladorrhinum sp. PSN332]
MPAFASSNFLIMAILFMLHQLGQSELGEVRPAGSCTILGPEPKQWGWIPHPTQPPTQPWLPNTIEISTFTAYTVVTVVNTVYSTTRLNTIYNEIPENFTMPPTNAYGTRVATMTYERHGTTSMTVLAYPTLFFQWPDYYQWSGTLIVTSTSGNATVHSCATASEPTPVYIMSNPQPLPTNNGELRRLFPDTPYNLTQDPFGLNYYLAPDAGSEYFPFGSFGLGLFDDQTPLQSCFLSGEGPRMGSWGAQVSWIIQSATSTIFEGSLAPSVPPFTAAATTTSDHQGDKSETPSTKGSLIAASTAWSNHATSTAEPIQSSGNDIDPGKKLDHGDGSTVIPGKSTEIIKQEIQHDHGTGNSNTQGTDTTESGTTDRVQNQDIPQRQGVHVHSQGLSSVHSLNQPNQANNDNNNYNIPQSPVTRTIQPGLHQTSSPDHSDSELDKNHNNNYIANPATPDDGSAQTGGFNSGSATPDSNVDDQPNRPLLTAPLPGASPASDGSNKQVYNPNSPSGATMETGRRESHSDKSSNLRRPTPATSAKSPDSTNESAVSPTSSSGSSAADTTSGIKVTWLGCVILGILFAV